MIKLGLVLPPIKSPGGSSKRGEEEVNGVGGVGELGPHGLEHGDEAGVDGVGVPVPRELVRVHLLQQRVLRSPRKPASSIRGWEEDGTMRQLRPIRMPSSSPSRFQTRRLRSLRQRKSFRRFVRPPSLQTKGKWGLG